MFAALSGLHVSPTKSHLILSKSAQHNRDRLLGVLGFQEGHLPIRYLGLPLIASRLSLSDCKPLLSKIDSRIRGWGGLQLSFAARVQLIKSGASGDGYPKVAWNQICLPIEEGGQGFRDILAINLALMSRHLWKIIQGNRDSIWVNWIYHVRLRGKSIWIVNDCTGSWGWRKLLQLRQWNWPLIPDIECLDIIYFLPTIHGGDDHISWRVEGGQFSNQEAYALFHPPGPKLGWSSLLLGLLKTPRNNFILWLDILDKLSTLDKPWLNHLDGTCILCSNGQLETHAYLFFSCSYSRMCINVIGQHV
ncbi:UNVERIFIED_CONTAM: hypothetical protein Slati_2913700 [Sesamum latifolium]|uniref:Reverse transcriptase zinc-binding domain-containing protein n=1 Tax=Sesamum latifolium TaxID=2727402 RepID=A0AAW2VCC7_9LAMI